MNTSATSGANASRTVLVTGGCGFIGVNLARSLVAAGYEPVAYDNLSTGRLEDGKAAGFAEIIEADILDADALARAARGVYGIVHLAARTGVVDSVEDPRGDLEVNVGGTLNALLAARDGGASAFVFASSGAPLGSVEPPGHEGLAPRPLSPYGASKLAGEGLCSAFAGSYGLPANALRFTNVYGPYSYHKGSVVAAFMKRIMDGGPLVVYGDGSQTRDFLFVDDLCRAVVAVLERRPQGELFQLGTGVETSVSELVAALVAVFPGREVDIRYEPARAGEIARSFSDIAHARRALDYRPSVSLDEGLRVTRDWFVSMQRA
ncbi:MAG TPA: NAD-dependent epimerase/dehydratase family protein [Acidimicrobiia bacterium]